MGSSSGKASNAPQSVSKALAKADAITDNLSYDELPLEGIFIGIQRVIRGINLLNETIGACQGASDAYKSLKEMHDWNQMQKLFPDLKGAGGKQFEDMKCKDLLKKIVKVQGSRPKSGSGSPRVGSGSGSGSKYGSVDPGSRGQNKDFKDANDAYGFKKKLGDPANKNKDVKELRDEGQKKHQAAFFSLANTVVLRVASWRFAGLTKRFLTIKQQGAQVSAIATLFQQFCEDWIEDGEFNEAAKGDIKKCFQRLFKLEKLVDQAYNALVAQRNEAIVDVTIGFASVAMGGFKAGADAFKNAKGIVDFAMNNPAETLQIAGGLALSAGGFYNGLNAQLFMWDLEPIRVAVKDLMAAYMALEEVKDYFKNFPDAKQEIMDAVMSDLAGEKQQADAKLDKDAAQFEQDNALPNLNDLLKDGQGK